MFSLLGTRVALGKDGLVGFGWWSWVVAVLVLVLGVFGFGFKFNCPVRSGFGCCLPLFSPPGMGLGFGLLTCFSNISCIILWILLPFGFGSCLSGCLFLMGQGGGFDWFVGDAGFGTAATAPTLDGIGWRPSWGPISFCLFSLLSLFSWRRSSPPPS